MRASCVRWCMALLIAAICPSVLHAESQRPIAVLELFGGKLYPATDDSGADPSTAPPPPRSVSLSQPGTVFGLRGGAEFRHLTLSASLSRYDRSKSEGGLSRTHLDFDVTRGFGPQAGFRLLLHGGLGAAWSRATDAQEQESRTRAFPCMSVGVGGQIPIGSRVFLHPDARVRWYASSHDETDWEVALGLGFRFGRDRSALGTIAGAAGRSP